MLFFTLLVNSDPNIAKMLVTNRKAKRFNFFAAITRDSEVVIFPGDLILSHLSKHDQLNLRRCSRDAAQFVEERMLPDLFSALHINCESVSAMQLRLAPRVLRYVATYCRELTIHIPRPAAVNGRGAAQGGNTEESAASPAGHAIGPPSPALQPASPTMPCGSPENWRHLLNLLSNLSVVTISCHDVAPWSGYSSAEQSLVTLREALESSTLSYMTTLRLDPIHAIGLLHFRWSGGAAYGSAHWTAGRLWKRISVLDLSLANPARLLGHDQQNTLIKVLHDYLNSFAPTLSELCFRWANAPGPNPIFLDELSAARRKKKDGVSAFSAPPLLWHALRKISLWNCQWDLGQIEALFGQRAPVLEECVAGADMMLTDEEQAMARLDALGVSHQLFFSGSNMFAPASHRTHSDGEDVWCFSRFFPHRPSAPEEQCGLNISGYLADDDMDADDGLDDDIGISSGGEDDDDDEDMESSGGSTRSSASLDAASPASSASGQETPQFLLPTVYVPVQHHANPEIPTSAYEADQEVPGPGQEDDEEKEDDELWGEIPIMLAVK